MTAKLDAIDRRLILATQHGLPLTPHPYRDIAGAIGIDANDVMTRLRRLVDHGVIRRIGAVPNHYALGYTANGMSVWDIADDTIDRLGPQVGALEFVSHCYHRPRHPPVWSYNLFAMLHGRDRTEVAAKMDQIAALVGTACRGHALLYSTRILKKTGLRLSA